MYYIIFLPNTKRGQNIGLKLAQVINSLIRGLMVSFVVMKEFMQGVMLQVVDSRRCPSVGRSKRILKES